MDSPNFIQSDHDLLIQIAVKIESLIASMNKLEASMNGKADQGDVAELRERVHDIEKQQEKLQEFRWRLIGIAIGASGVVSLAIKFLIGH
jgi:hypothetical protein